MASASVYPRALAWPEKKMGFTHMNKIVLGKQVPREATAFAIANALGYTDAEAMRTDWLLNTGPSQA
jgi:predicted outer membrane lipoprotein